MDSRGQTTISMIILITVSMTILLVIIYSSQKAMDSSNSELNNEKAVIAAEELTGAVEQVHAQGDGSTIRKYIAFPDGVSQISITGNVIAVVMSDGNTIARSTTVNMTGDINKTKGQQYITIKSLPNGVVNLSSSK
jgi:hypothetical protein